ncbi:hypothetical protein ACHHYP_10356 [Achlya hypogyna]|uniref:Arrestin C-terminal-like domain-containing protein n=1 Tax=Achlya hypogyna TaxID=1202772 RepID=A0A1V9YLM0_ACHHY|nr:hypothetical protein ACHHYP_10356 [Achlya hypogyna]
MVLSIALDKEFYTTGDTLSGRAIVDTAPSHATELVLTVVGKEKVVLPASTKAKEATKQSHTFFEKTVDCDPILLVVAKIPPLAASTSVAFQLDWPEELPGSYENVRHAGLRAKIKYTLHARLIDDQSQMAHTKNSLLLYGTTTYVAKPYSDNQSQKILFLKCLSQGQCSVQMTLDKNIYALGDRIQITADIQNSSRRRVRCIHYMCTQDVRVRVGRENLLFSSHVGSQTCAGLAPYKSIVRTDCCDALLNNMYPSTEGKLLRVDYTLHVVVEIPSCPNVELDLPIVVGAPHSTIFLPPPTPMHLKKNV